ncbi:MAG: ribosome biogenesis GTPase Der [Lentisphaeria bacterium]|nr:ribosome biogenesis GTPase Der [Lentisphaeria bacterium]
MCADSVSSTESNSTPASAPELPVVVIVGRPNVGKSALFNRILGRRVAIVHEQSGVTRDRVAAPARFRGRQVMLVDTGGLGVRLRETHGLDVFDGLIRDQVARIVEEATAVVWVVDCQTGLTPQDEEIAAFLRESRRPVFLAANKADNESLAEAAEGEFSPLGFEPVYPVTCSHNQGLGELLAGLAAAVPAGGGDIGATEGLKLAVVGRPNVGKSSLVNRLLGDERVIVSEVAGTTRDAIDVPLVLTDGEENVHVTLIDTAGLRRRRQVDTVVDFFSMSRTEGAIRRSDAVLFLLDATAPATAQDRRIARLIQDARKPCIVVANKWDLLTGTGTRQRELQQTIRERMPFMAHAPIVVVCAASGYNLDALLDRVLAVREQMSVRIPTGVLNQFLQDTLARTPPSAVGGKRLKILYGTMVAHPPPHIVLFVNERKAFQSHYLQFLENRIREAFFPEAGLPIRLDVRQRQGTGGDRVGARRAAAGARQRQQAQTEARKRHSARRKGWRKR